MAALWILGILLALIVAALFLRVGVRIAFGQELRVTAAAGPVPVSYTHLTLPTTSRV